MRTLKFARGAIFLALVTLNYDNQAIASSITNSKSRADLMNDIRYSVEESDVLSILRNPIVSLSA